MRRVLWLLTILMALPVSAQIPETFENLQVYPEDIDQRELIGIMRGFAGALGVRCSHCHKGPDNLQGMDFKTDELPAKRVAREMIKMVDSINTGTLAKLDTGREASVEVQCRTCHHGLSVPTTIDNAIKTRLESDGLESAIALYRELRERHYGGDAYDFSRNPLNSLAERLGRSDKLDDSLALLKLNLEYHPEDAYTYLVLGQIHAARGEIPDAIAATKRAIEIEPDNGWAKQTLQRLEAAGNE